MANNLLMLFKLDADTIAFLSLIVSIVGAVAAIFAAFYAKKAATKDDVTRVEQNTQYVEHFSNKILSIDTPIQPQEKQEAPMTQAQREASPVQVEPEASQAEPQRISISVKGEAMGEVPLDRNRFLSSNRGSGLILVFRERS